MDKKDFLNFAIIGEWNFDRVFPGNCYSNGIPIAADTWDVAYEV